MKDEGRAAPVERMILYKRSTLPLSLPLLAVLGLPLGGRGLRPASAVVAVTLSWWAATRICDQSVGSLGPIWAASLPLIGLSIGVIVAWVGWSER